MSVIRVALLITAILATIISVIALVRLLRTSEGHTFSLAPGGRSLTVIQQSNTKGSPSTIAFVTGYIGNEKTLTARPLSGFIPKVPVPGHSFYVTNLRSVYDNAVAAGWSARLVMVKGDMNDILDTGMVSKMLKVFPQRYIASNKYEHVVWFDNKFDVNTEGTLSAAQSWDSNKALLMHQHSFLCGDELDCGADEELQESMKQARYKKQEDSYVRYMSAEAKAGYPPHGTRHFQTGYLLYNLKHPDCYRIQNLWMEHILRCGIQCQISMYYVAQRFPRSIGEFPYDIESPGSHQR